MAPLWLFLLCRGWYPAHDDFDLLAKHGDRILAFFILEDERLPPLALLRALDRPLHPLLDEVDGAGELEGLTSFSEDEVGFGIVFLGCHPGSFPM